jgi:hypothetical protein
MANEAEFLARWKARYIDAEGRILEELDTASLNAWRMRTRKDFPAKI